MIKSNQLRGAEYRGKRLVKQLFDAFSDHDHSGEELLPKDVRARFAANKSMPEKKRVICDYISGMTDRYAIEIHDRLFGRGVTIFRQV